MHYFTEMNVKLTLVLLMLTAACERAADDQPADAANDTASADSAAADTTPAIARSVAPTKFDFATVKAGDRVGSLTVKQVRRPPNDPSVTFSGQVELNGSYRAHFDYPEVKEPCFWVDPDSWAKLPRSSSDQRLIWFCFDNANEAVRQLGALGTQARATIVVDDYKTALSESDVWDSARLVRVIRKEPIQ